MVNFTIIWFSKNQNTVENSTFESESSEVRIVIGLILELCYKLRVFFVPLYEPSNVMCYNQGVVKNTILPQSNLGNKNNAVNYHVLHEEDAVGILQVGKEDTENNLDDILKNILV